MLRAVREPGLSSSTRRCATPSRRSRGDTDARARCSLLRRRRRRACCRALARGRRARARRRGRRHRPRPAALHLGHDVAAQGRDDDPPGARPRVRLVRRRRSTCARTTPAALDAALPLGADARRSSCPTSRSARRTTSSSGPTLATILERVETDAHRLALRSRRRCGCRCRTTPTSTRRDLDVAAQGVLRRVDHARAGADRLQRARCPGSASTTASASRRSAPLATVLRPEEHDERPDSAGRPVLFVEVARRRRRGLRRRGRRAGRGALPLTAAVHRLLGQAGRDRARPSRGGWFHSGDLVTRRRGGLHLRRRPHQGRHQHRRRPGRLAARSRTRSTRTPPSPRSPSSRPRTSGGSRRSRAVVVLRAGRP